jgi:hypothetical protein
MSYANTFGVSSALAVNTSKFSYAGSATLVAGTVDVTVPFVPASAVVLLQPVGTAVGAGNDTLSVSAIADPGEATASFSIFSSDNTDVRVVKYVVLLTA